MHQPAEPDNSFSNVGTSTYFILLRIKFDFRLIGTKNGYCTKGNCTMVEGNSFYRIRKGFKSNRTVHSNIEMFRKICDKNGKITKKILRKCRLLLMYRSTVCLIWKLCLKKLQCCQLLWNWISPVWKLQNLLSHYFNKWFVNATYAFKKGVSKCWFHEISIWWEKISRFSTLCFHNYIEWE